MERSGTMILGHKTTGFFQRVITQLQSASPVVDVPCQGASKRYVTGSDLLNDICQRAYSIAEGLANLDIKKLQ